MLLFIAERTRTYIMDNGKGIPVWIGMWGVLDAIHCRNNDGVTLAIQVLQKGIHHIDTLPNR